MASLTATIFSEIKAVVVVVEDGSGAGTVTCCGASCARAGGSGSGLDVEGAERLEEVIGRKEEEELPRFQNGVFEVDGGPGFRGSPHRLVADELLDRYVPRGGIGTHTMRDLFGSARIVRSDHFECQQWVEEPTLLVTCFEYANLFHTVTDWYSAYVSSRVTGLPNRPNVIFVDGHCMKPCMGW